MLFICLGQDNFIKLFSTFLKNLITEIPQKLSRKYREVLFQGSSADATPRPVLASVQRGMGKCYGVRVKNWSVVLYPCTSASVASTTSTTPTPATAANSVDTDLFFTAMLSFSMCSLNWPTGTTRDPAFIAPSVLGGGIRPTASPSERVQPRSGYTGEHLSSATAPQRTSFRTTTLSLAYRAMQTRRES